MEILHGISTKPITDAIHSLNGKRQSPNIGLV